MPTLLDRWRKFRGPSKAELSQAVVALQNEIARSRPIMRGISSGVEINYGQFEYEQNSKLRGSDRWDEFDKMALDPHIKGALRNAIIPLQNADWEIKPAGDSPRDEEIAEFVTANLLRIGGDRYGKDYFCATPWKTQRLPEILDMLESGFSLVAKTVKVVNGKRVYDRLQWLEPRSVDPYGWRLDNFDNLVAVERTFSTAAKFAQDYKFEQEIPVEDLALFVWDLKGARFEGRPFTRSMYGAWMRKEFKQRMSAIWAQKVGAPVPYGYYPKGFPTELYPQFQRFVESLRGTSPGEAFFMGPMGDDNKPPEVGYLGASHDVERGFTETIDSENREIGHGGSHTTGNLGETESGSRALGSAKGLMEMVAVEMLAEVVSEQVTHGVANVRGMIEELVDWNFANVEEYPRLVTSKLNVFALEKAFEDTVKAWEKGIIPKVPDARRQIVETHLGLNLPDDVYEIEEPPPMLPVGGQPFSPAQEDDDGGGPQNPDNRMAAALESRESFQRRIAPLLEPVEDAPSGGGFPGQDEAGGPGR